MFNSDTERGRSARVAQRMARESQAPSDTNRNVSASLNDNNKISGHRQSALCFQVVVLNSAAS